MTQSAAAIELPAWRPLSVHDDGLANLLQTEAILPAQYWSDRRRDMRSEPERRLLLAVLEDALLTLLRHRMRTSAISRRLIAETESWISSERCESPFDFIPLCDVLDIDASYIRTIIHRTRGHDLPSPIRRRSHAGRGHHKVRDTTRRRRRAG